MALQFIAGPAGSGKSYYIYKEIIERSMEQKDGSFFIIVPEQFSMEAQKAVALLHPTHSLINIDILSFNRLAYRVFEETGQRRVSILEDMGKLLVLQKVLNENKSRLKVLKGMAGKSGAASQLNSLLSEMIQYRVDPGSIELEKKGISPLLKGKIEDVSLLGVRFFEYIEEKYLTMEEVPEVLSSVVEAYAPLKGATVVFDGFTGFVPTQIQVINRLLKICEKVYVTVTADRSSGLFSKSPESDLFHLSHKTAETLAKGAKDTGVEIENVIWVEHSDKSRFGNNEPLHFLERQLFRYENKSYEELQDRIFIGEASNMAEEVETASEIVHRLVREEGYRYRDFAFVTGDIELYGETAETVFRANGIPCFSDKKQSVLTNPAVEFVRASVNMAVEDFSYKSVFRWLKTGMTPLSRDEIYLLENYVLASGIKGFKNYKREWTKTFVTIEDAELSVVNAAREKLVVAVEDYICAFKERGADVLKRTSALYELIAQNHIQEKCKEFEEKFKEEGEFARASEYSQIYRAIMSVFEKLTEIMRSDKVSLKLYKQLLETAFEDMRLGLIPPSQDRLLIGDIERSRLNGIKIMFFAGLNEGVVPKTIDGSGLLTESERAVLTDMGIALAPSLREMMYRQRLYLYLNLTKPTDRLYLSYSKKSADGEAVLPSYLIGAIKDLFPSIEVAVLSKRDITLRLETPLGRKQLLIEGYEGLTEKALQGEVSELAAKYMQKPKTKAVTDMLLRAVKERRPETKIQKKSAEALYGKNTPYSASRIEMFSQCAFRHFISYALRLKERDIFDFTASDIGSILHDAVRLFCEEMKKRGWKELSEEDRDSIADATLRAAYDASPSAANSSGRVFDIARLGAINRKTAWSITEQMKRGSFVPYGFETRFMLDGTKGIIDRVDVCRLGDVLYVRVIDYKSGTKNLNLNELYYGTQLQLPLYMTAARQIVGLKNRGAAVQPAGMYYYAMSNPIIEVNGIDEKADEESVLKELKLRGITRNDPEVLRLTDSSLMPGASSDIVRIKINKELGENGEYVFDKYSRVLEKGDFYLIENYVKTKIKDVRGSIEDGRADIDPKIRGENDSCAYCAYRSICRFDDKMPGYKKLRYAQEDDAAVLKKMARDIGKDRDGDRVD